MIIKEKRCFSNHYCPFKNGPMTLEPLLGSAFEDFLGVSDLNEEWHIVHSDNLLAAGEEDVHWQDAVRPDHGLPVMEDLSSDRWPPELGCKKWSPTNRKITDSEDKDGTHT